MLPDCDISCILHNLKKPAPSREDENEEKRGDFRVEPVDDEEPGHVNRATPLHFDPGFNIINFNESKFIKKTLSPGTLEKTFVLSLKARIE